MSSRGVKPPATVPADRERDIRYLQHFGVPFLINDALEAVLDQQPRDPLAALEKHLRAASANPNPVPEDGMASLSRLQKEETPPVTKEPSDDGEGSPDRAVSPISVGTDVGDSGRASPAKADNETDETAQEVEDGANPAPAAEENEKETENATEATAAVEQHSRVKTIFVRVDGTRDSDSVLVDQWLAQNPTVEITARCGGSQHAFPSGATVEKSVDGNLQWTGVSFALEVPDDVEGELNVDFGLLGGRSSDADEGAPAFREVAHARYTQTVVLPTEEAERLSDKAIEVTVPLRDFDIGEGSRMALVLLITVDV